MRVERDFVPAPGRPPRLEEPGPARFGINRTIDQDRARNSDSALTRLVESRSTA